MQVITWNVLHRIHAMNWSEPVLATWPDEVARSGSIADFLSATAADVICLQEVSGDQLAMLRDVEDGELFASPYPRVPRLRRSHASPLRDPGEYLVTIVRGTGARLVAFAAFATDPGKGFQRVELASGITAINTHVSFGDKRPAQLARLADAARDAPALAVVCGDFNADRATCMAELGEDFVPGMPAAPALPTRPRQPRQDGGEGKAQDIDHVFVRGGVPLAAAVLDGEGRSDHNPVRVRVELVS